MDRRLRMVSVGALGMAFAAAGAARAEVCAGPGDRPAVCTVEFSGAFAGNRLSALDPSNPLDLPPGQTFELELGALDQSRRPFPENRLAFGLYGDDCRGLVEVVETGIGRFDLRAGTRQGECDLWLWVPGNLNLEWRLRVRAVPRGRAAYSRAEAELIAQRLYQALLGREADPEGLRATTIEIQSGNLEGRTLEMLRSPGHREQTVGKTPDVVLEQLYGGIFGRKPDTAGVRAFLPMLQRGQAALVLREMLQSEEFERILSNQEGKK